MSFGAHLVDILSVPRHGKVEVTYHAPLPVAEFQDRKALSAACEAAVRDGFPEALRAPG